VNGYPVQQAQVSHGDVITVGTANLVFRAGGSYGLPFALPTAVQRWAPVEPVSNAAPPVVSTNWGVAVAVATQPQQLVDLKGGSVVLQPGRNTVGRSPDCTVCLNFDNTVSRNHAEIVVSPGGTTVQDLGSSNGTRVNGHDVQGVVPLNAGDQVEFGSASFRVM